MFIYLYKLTYTVRILAYFIVATVVIVILPLIAKYCSPESGFWISFAILMFFGIFAGIGQASVYAYAGMLPPKYIGAVMVGNGVSGILIGVLRLITLLIFPHK